MSTAEPIVVQAGEEQLAPVELSPRLLARLENLLERLGERLNPILVKETRQALKGKQFSITFALLVLFAWLWSLAGVAAIGPDIVYRVSGPQMFFGYYVILTFPLLVIVPYGAFRSLAGEREDGTYELLAITTLRPRQIIGGKLGSAVVQMGVYLSALSPCLAFTYMLRGIDVLTILLVIFYTVQASLGLSVAALLLATITREKHWQIMISVALVAGLFLPFWGALGLAFELVLEERLPVDTSEFWLANAMIQTAYWSYFALVYLAAASQVTFASDNRSTPLRIAMVVQHVLFAGWMGWGYALVIESGWDRDLAPLLLSGLTIAGLHWYAMGALLLGESPRLSPRVRRSLPQSFLGRTFFTWFNPGPATGYMFALANLAGAVVLAGLGLAVWWLTAAPTAGPAQLWWIAPESVVRFALVGYAYVAIYLGVGNLICIAARKVTAVGPFLSVLVQVLLVLGGCGIPGLIHAMSDLRHGGYNLLQITNPIWTLVEIVDNRTGSLVTDIVPWLLVPLAVVVWLANLPLIAVEVRQARIPKPQRVVEEEQSTAAQAPPPAPISPFD